MRKRREQPEAEEKQHDRCASFSLSEDPADARREMFGLIFYLTTFGYIDGEYDPRETAFIRQTIDRVVECWVAAAGEEHDPAEIEARAKKDAAFFNDLFDAVQNEVVDLLNTSVIEAETRHVFLGCKLKQRCFELFRTYNLTQQEELLAVADELLMADGVAHPAEVALRQELAEILAERLEPKTMPVELELVRPKIKLDDRVAMPRPPQAPAAFESFEYHYSADKKVIRRQVATDRSLIKRVLFGFDKERRRSRGRLRGVEKVDELAGQGALLDGHVRALMPERDQRYLITVLGDLHGCYSCMKAALIQSRFFERVAAFRRDPDNNPEPKLIFLGDYIDRGRFSFNGVLRLALQLQAAAPDHVIMLRGNHESFIEERGRVRSIVSPADALETLRPFAPEALFRDYRRLFDELPHVLLLGRMIITHGGIPSDSTLQAHSRELTSLDEPAQRFQMMWSDPALVDIIPRHMQDQLVRFSFGRLQCQAFLQRHGCHTLIRGHGQPVTGFRPNFYDDEVVVLTICSAGGPDNLDLPETSELRMVRPMAMTIRLAGGLDGEAEIDVWPIDYKPYNVPERNGFYRSEPDFELIEVRPSMLP